ncbi:MAG: neutral/alkaline non-lysosomal ceramidase N-terminal domain-containing protein [Armatimonadetes bacterium]|nr:neutral/alkaline non-lysosomal ceramidase N-terminal domain-containing protein [Armatimonadota bacterium]
MAYWYAGASEVVITPPVGVDMTGFAGRPSGAVGIHDDLYARALVVEAEGVRAALVATDVLSLEFSLVAKIRSLVEEQCAIPAERLLLNSSHTHSGPAAITLRGLGTADGAYLDVLARAVAGAVKMATDRLAPARLSFGAAPIRIGINRREKRPDGAMVLGRSPSGPYDASVCVLRADHESGDPMALLFSHATHPVTMGGANLLFSADYPGAAVEALCRLTGREGKTPVAMFAQGCCGDINSEPVGGTFEDVRRLGTLLGSAAAIASETAVPVQPAGIRSGVEMLQLPFLPPPPESEAVTAYEAARARLAQLEAQDASPAHQRMQQAMADWAEDALRAARSPGDYTHQPFEIQALAIGDTAFVALPGEVFIAYALNIRKQSPFTQTVVLAYSNGCIGYVPTADAYPDGGYEVSQAYQYYGTLMIAPESEGMILDAAAGLLKRLD